MTKMKRKCDQVYIRFLFVYRGTQMVAIQEFLKKFQQNFEELIQNYWRKISFPVVGIPPSNKPYYLESPSELFKNIAVIKADEIPTAQVDE